MPYSRNPDKYPLEIQQLPQLLRNARQDAYDIAARDLSEAKGRRTQIQAFFAAVERRAAEMRQLAGRAAANSDAGAIAEVWEDRARTVAGWMVRVIEPQAGLTTVPLVQIARRTTGDFGKALANAFAATPKVEAPVPPPAESLADQFALLRKATEQLEEQKRQELAARYGTTPAGSNPAESAKTD